MNFAICILIFALLGIVVNIGAFIVISKKKNCSMFHDLLKVLTVYDILVVICCALQFALPELWSVYANNIHPYVVVILLPLFEIRTEEKINENIKLINCRKYLKVDFLLNNPTDRLVIQQQLNLTHVQGIRRLAELCRQQYEFRGINSSGFRNVTLSKTTSLSVVSTALRKNVYYHNIYFVYMNTLFASVLPLCLLLFFNTKTAHELIIMSRYERNHPVSVVSCQNNSNTHLHRDSIVLYSFNENENPQDQNSINERESILQLENVSDDENVHCNQFNLDADNSLHEEITNDSVREKGNVKFGDFRISSRKKRYSVPGSANPQTRAVTIKHSRNSGFRRSLQKNAKISK
ncbi:unnamed protein product [Lepeophtheirus salmonis]|uniref:(salmon louse) hypothetical protein n=1 Tax=Lepeophtheirus salmonis TaxID=72036 RepID=A0A7R8D1V3_LEPSM|nr:unnamed protein product [Lepeophtheirus salmonis]CAF2999462.1 unnamed protein product [Lepeophtheirus salmonis]